MSNPKLKNIVEGFLFASDKALNVDHIVKMFPEGERPDKAEIEAALQTIEAEFEDHGIELKKVSTGYRFQVREEYTQWVSRLWEEKPQKYTRALLETLALIVYRQPITRGEIEEIRGVSVSSNIVRTLQEREWVKIVGHRDVPGRPALLASTKQFLDYFNLESLEALPPLSEIKDLDAIATELDPEQNAALISAIREMQEDQKKTDEQAGEASDNGEMTEDGQVSSEVESPETIAAELDVVIEEEKKIEVAEEVIEAELNEQIEHGLEEDNVLSEESNEVEASEEANETALNEQSTSVLDEKNILHDEVIEENPMDDEMSEVGEDSSRFKDSKIGEVES